MPTRTLAAAALALLFALARPAASAAQSAADQALLVSIPSNDVAAAEAALRAGANPRLANENGTALAMAAMFGSADVVRVLLEHGADPAGPGPRGGTALSTAFFAMNGMVLLGRGDRPDPAQRARALEVVRLLAARKVGLDEAVRIGPTSMTPLMQAADAGALDVVRILLDAGADPNATNGGGYTALDYAVDRAPVWSTFPISGRVEIVRALLAKGARAHRAGRDGVTPLVRAQRAGNAQIVALLQAAGR